MTLEFHIMSSCHNKEELHQKLLIIKSYVHLFNKYLWSAAICPDYVNKKGKVPALLDSICSGEGEKKD